MRADDVIQAFVAALEGDAALITALGGEHIYRAGANREPQIPSVEWRRITNGIAENTEPMLFQFDVWARGYAAAMAIEARLRAVLNRRGEHLDLGGGMVLFSGLDDSRDHEDPEPGVVHTSLDFRFEPAREEV